MGILKNIKYLFLLLVLVSCRNSSQQEKADDFLNDFLVSEISFLNDNSVGIIKKIDVDDSTEIRDYKPDWNKELSFINEYINDYRTKGKLKNPEIVVAGDTSIQVYRKSAKKTLTVKLVNKKVVEFQVEDYQKSILSNRTFSLLYTGKKGYSLLDKSISIWVMKSNVEINSTFMTP